MKKLFHRKKDSNPSSPEQASPRSQEPQYNPGNTNLRSSLYEHTSSAGLPQTGAYPLKGNSSSTALSGRRSRTNSRARQSSEYDYPLAPPISSPYYGSLPAPRVTSSAGNDATSYAPNRTNPPQSARTPAQAYDPDSQQPLSSDFSRLNIGEQSRSYGADPYSGHWHDQAESTDGRHGLPTSSKDQGQRYRKIRTSEDASPSIRMINSTDTQQQVHDVEQGQEFYPYGRIENESDLLDQYRDPGRSAEHKAMTSHGLPASSSSLENLRIGRQRSIPRKEIGTPSKPPLIGEQASASRKTPAMQYQEDVKSKHSVPSRGNEAQFRDMQHQQPAIPNRNPQTLDGADHEAQGTIERAKYNTYDTEVIESMAPAVIQEKIYQDVHHIREEVVTREIHNHDVYHRILPVIDVEVLPPRHFLPVEGGGLVEISGKEVPGRGSNWVIAETASKIPSDQPAPVFANRFSARKFTGSEGDAIRYVTAEGYERTEQTWVHPPKLETGGQESGQTWPMEFDSESVSKKNHNYTVPKTARAKHSKAPSGPAPSSERKRDQTRRGGGI